MQGLIGIDIKVLYLEFDDIFMDFYTCQNSESDNILNGCNLLYLNCQQIVEENQKSVKIFYQKVMRTY